MNHLPIIFLLLLLPTWASSQSKCYQIALEKGDDYYNQKNYTKAKEIWENAKECPQANIQTLNARILNANDADGDGVVNGKDKCPDVSAKTANGCPLSSSKPEPVQPPIFSDPFKNQMVPVPGDAFTMGCKDGRDLVCDDDEKPAHTVILSNYKIGKYEVTQAQWRKVMGTNPPKLYNKDCDQCPVEGVSWNDIQAFLKKLNAKTGKRYRLPTEAEWEFAARGGNKSKGYQYAGGNDPNSVAWNSVNCRDGNIHGTQKTTRPVGGKTPNELGLHDMSGNVWEWCSDWYGPYELGAQTNPKGPGSGEYRVLRGGSWGLIPWRCRSALRLRSKASDRCSSCGFRLAQD